MADFTFGLIGTGWQAECHANAILKQDSAELGAVRSHKLKRAEEFASRHGSIASYEETEYLLENHDIDGIIVATVLEDRAECIRLALRSGRPVVASSPFADCYEDAAELIRISEEEGASLTPFVTRRYSESICAVKKAIEEGRFGRILKIAVSYLSDKSESSYAADYDPHPILYKEGYEALDTLLFLMGKPKLISAFSGNIAGRSEYEDILSVSFIGDKAVHGCLTIASSAFSENAFSVSIIGTEGVCDYKNGHLSCPFGLEMNDEKRGIDSFYADYLSSLFAGTETLSTMSDGALALRVIEAIASASKRVDFPET